MGNVACCAGEGGATPVEKQQGIAATGRVNQRIPMAEHIWCQQINSGSYPGNKFLQFTPAGVATLVATKRAKELYMNLKVDIDMDAGGQEPQGWNVVALHKVVERYKADFHTCGIRLTFCVASFWDWSPNGNANYQEVVYRQWLEFADVSQLPRSARLPASAYDPHFNYANPPRI